MSSKAKTLARRLLRENRGTRTKPARSWRVISRENFDNRIPAGTLCRFAKAEGEWIPKDEELLIALGMKRERKAKAEKPFTPISEMATSHLRKALIGRKEIPPVDPRIIKEFTRLGWIAKEKRTRK